MKRRNFLWMVGAGVLSTVIPGRVQGSRQPKWRMPDEAAPHACTWMAFGAQKAIWGRRLLPAVQKDLALIANTISKYEPVRMLVREQDMPLVKSLCDARVELIPAALDDLWMRDTSAVFVKHADGELAGVDFNFNGWGEKQDYEQDAQVAGLVTELADTRYLASNLVLEGGCIEVDGEGTAIIAESCVLNPNRNPKVAKSDCEAELKRLLGLQKIIWIPGVAGQDITDGHTDFYARFIRPGVVVVGLESDKAYDDYHITREHLQILQTAKDAQGRSLDVVPLHSPLQVREKYDSDEFAAGYVGFYVVNGAVLMQQFGDKQADDEARATLQRLYPERTIEVLNVDALAAGGGSIHCATQQQPA